MVRKLHGEWGIPAESLLRAYDPVIFRMSTDELHQHTLVPIGNMNDEPVSVSAEIEDGPVVGYEIDRRPEFSSDIDRAHPNRPCVPVAYRGLCLGVPIPELTQSSKRDDLHSNQDKSFP
jgi:hypothetical protein